MFEYLNYSYPRLLDYVRETTGKTQTYGDALFRHIYGSPKGCTAFRESEAFRGFLDEHLREDLPAFVGRQEESGTVKFLLGMDMSEDTENSEGCIGSESVIIPMQGHSTLCVSSQLGCRYGCSFCATGQLGLIRNLSTAEVVSQILRARQQPEGKNLQNIVFMGMGEPLDNFENVIESIRILSDERGLNIPKRRISLSTAGHAEGIRRLSALCLDEKDKHFHTLHLSLSLHSADEETRRELMPITRIYPLKELKAALADSPYAKLKDGLYIEYLHIPGVTDRERDLVALKTFLEGLRANINLIPYNPVKGSPWRAPTNEETDKLWSDIRKEGYACRTRKSKGESMMAACGQLGSRS